MNLGSDSLGKSNDFRSVGVSDSLRIQIHCESDPDPIIEYARNQQRILSLNSRRTTGCLVQANIQPVVQPLLTTGCIV